MGTPGRVLEGRRAAPGGHRVAHSALHRARRHCAVERRGARGGAAVCGRAGRAAGTWRRWSPASRRRRRCSPRSPSRWLGSSSVDACKMFRYERRRDGHGRRGLGRVQLPDSVGARLRSRATTSISEVYRTGHPARVDDYATATGAIVRHRRAPTASTSAVGGPIVVDGRLWGAVVVAARGAEPLPAGTEARIGEFTELVATAISNIEARSELAESRARIVAAGRRRAPARGARSARRRAAAARPHRDHAEVRPPGARAGRRRARPRLRGTQECRGDDRGAARARPRHHARRP